MACLFSHCTASLTKYARTRNFNHCTEFIFSASRYTQPHYRLQQLLKPALHREIPLCAAKKYQQHHRFSMWHDDKRHAGISFAHALANIGDLYRCAAGIFYHNLNKLSSCIDGIFDQLFKYRRRTLNTASPAAIWLATASGSNWITSLIRIIIVFAITFVVTMLFLKYKNAAEYSLEWFYPAEFINNVQ